MSIYDRWHKAHPAPGDQPCREHSKGRTKLYPTASHGTGDRWQVRWRDENSQQRKRNFARRDGTDPDKQAAAFNAKIKRELDTGTSLDIKAGQLKVRDYAAEYRRDLHACRRLVQCDLDVFRCCRRSGNRHLTLHGRLTARGPAPPALHPLG
jgi:hypothetical protein